MKIMTFNIRNDGIIPFSKWKIRLEGFVNLIKQEKPDIIGTQEMTYKAKKYLETLIKDEYIFYGKSRKRTNTTYDEYNCILVKKNIKVLNTYTYSLSETPLTPKTKFKGDPFPRIITFIETDDFYIYNTHLTAKISKNKLLQLNCITNLLKRNKPIIIMGDFNLGIKKLESFTNKNNLINTTKDIGKTYSTKKELFHLDHILISKELKYKNTMKYNYKYKNKYISDHYPIMTEIRKDNNMNKYMKIAKELANKNLITNDGGPFGACIVKDGEIIGKGSNHVLKNNDPTAHAEIMAIRDACQKLNTYDLKDCELYTSCYPCPMCLSAIIWSNIKTVYYGNTKEDAANIGFRDDFIYNYINNLTKDKQNEETLKLIKLNREETIEEFNKFKEKTDKTIY